MKRLVVLVVLVGLATALARPKATHAKARHKHASLESIENAVASIPEKQTVLKQPQEKFVSNLGDAIKLLKQKDEMIADMRSKLYNVVNGDQAATGTEEFVLDQQTMFESFQALTMPSTSDRTNLVKDYVPEVVEIYIDGQFKTMCYADRALSGACESAFSGATTIREQLSDVLSSSAVEGLAGSSADCKSSSTSALLFVEQASVSKEKRSAVCIQYGEDKMYAQYWLPSVSTSVNYEFQESKIPQIKPRLLQDYLHAIRRYNTANHKSTSPLDLVSFLKVWSKHISEFEKSEFDTFVGEHATDLSDDWGGNKKLLKDNLRTAVRLFVLQEAASDNRISWQTVERYLPQLPPKAKDRSDAGFLVFTPGSSSQSNSVQRIIKNPRHRFAIRGKLSTVTE